MMLYCKECQKMTAVIGELVCKECASKIRCRYCGKLNTVENSQKAVIWVNRSRREMWFCGKECACKHYYQMGAEG